MQPPDRLQHLANANIAAVSPNVGDATFIHSEPRHLGALVNLYSLLACSLGIPPGNGVMASCASIRMPQTTQHLVLTTFVKVHQGADFARRCRVDDLDADAHMLAHLCPQMERAQGCLGVCKR